ncbi:MAG: hypothetical protein J1F01_07895 [Oscillospiraceae bacterium]|nr:hypothetical protein [Oscillospiraceae bacterium]
MSNTKITLKRNQKNEVIAAIVSKTFRKRADIFGTQEYDEWEKIVAKHPKAKMVVIKNKKIQPKAEKRIRPSYDKMIDFIKTQDNSEMYLEEMRRIKKMTAINGNSYNTVVKWFNNTFENTADYKLTFKEIIEEKPVAEKVVDIKRVVNE